MLQKYHKLIFISLILSISTLYTLSNIQSGSFDDDQKELGIYQQIQKFYNTGEAFEAHRLAQQFIKIYPKSLRRSEVFYILGETERQFYKSIFFYRKILQRYPTSYWAVKAKFAIAMKYYTIGTYALAEKEFRTFILNYPKSQLIPRANYYRALCYQQLQTTQNNESALTVFHHLKKTYPDSKWTKLSLAHMGNLYFALNNYPNAIFYLDKALENVNDTTKPLLMEKIGISHIKMGKRSKGKNVLRKLLKDYPKSTAAQRVSRIYF